MLKQKTILIAMLAVSLATTGSVHAEGPTSLNTKNTMLADDSTYAVPQAQAERLNEDEILSYCFDGYYDGGGNDNFLYEEFCFGWLESNDGYTNFLGVDKTFYDMGDPMLISAYQDPDDPMIATDGFFTIWEGEEELIEYELAGDYHTITVRLIDDIFEPGCYGVSVWYDTPRIFDDEAWDTLDFCILSDDGTVPLPATTGVEGKVYRDTNGNDRLDPGEQGMPGITVLTVNMADWDDVNRTTTDANGDYSIGLDAGSYLVQAEGTFAYAYITIPDGSITVLNLGS